MDTKRANLQSMPESAPVALLGGIAGILCLALLVVPLRADLRTLPSCQPCCESDAGGIEQQATEPPAIALADSSYAQLALPVEEILQYEEGLPAGCEPVSLTIALRSLGFDITAQQLLDDFLPTDPTWTNVYAYTGSPYISGQALPPAIVGAANAYLRTQGAPIQAADISGISFDELLSIVGEGTPVVLWTTLDLGDPAFDGRQVSGYPWYSNEHCVVLYGVDGDEALVSDPIDGLVREDAARFGEVFEACGSYAVCFEYEER